MAGQSTTFGQWVRQTRRDLGITQESLAFDVGCAFETIRKIESGSRRPSRQMAELIGRALGVPEHDMAAFVESARTSQAVRNGRRATNGGSTARRSAKSASRSATSTDARRQASELPSPPTGFVGRRHEINAVRELLLAGDSRLVTLLGPPGIGKTRLAIEAAHACRSDFEHGVHFVALASVTEADLFTPTLAAVLDIKSTKDLRRSIYDQLRERPTLLVLDNMEHILAAREEVAALLRACPALRVLTTSREPLHIYGEKEYTVPPLTHAQLDTSGASAGGPTLLYEEFEATQLFLQRAQDVEPGLQLTGENAYHIAHICWALDGMPLAIELAAVHCKTLTPKAISERLSGRLKLLTRGASDLPDRQRTLRGAIDWSYSLLNEKERRLFNRLGIFTGGALLEAIEAVGLLSTDRDLDAFEVVASLVDKCLLRKETDEDGEPRYFMLWTIREYALERLAESGDLAKISARHATFYLTLAEQAEPAITGPRRESWLTRLDAELYNLRAAMQWALGAEQASASHDAAGSNAETALRIAGALHWFWYLRGHYSEGRDWLERALAVVQLDVNDNRQNGSKAARARALEAAARLALAQSDHALILQRLQESVALWREIDNKRGLAYTLSHLGGTTVYLSQDNRQDGQGLIQEAIDLLKEAGDKWGLAFAFDYMGDALSLLGISQEDVAGYKQQSLILYRDLNDRWGIATMLTELGYIAIYQDDYATARKRLEEALLMTREVGDKRYIALAIAVLAEVIWHMGNPMEARRLFTESLAFYRELGDRLGEANALRNLGHIAHREGDAREAGKLYYQSLRIAREVGNERNIAILLVALAGLIGAFDKPRQAARLLGIADSQLEANGGTLPPTDRIQRVYIYETLRSALGDVRLAEEMEHGQALSMEKGLQLVEADLTALWV